MRTTILIVLSVLFLFSCSRESDNKATVFDPGPEIAVVNSDTISSEMFTDAFIQHLLNSGQNDTREMRFRFLNDLLNDVLLSQKAEEYGLIDEKYQDYKRQVKRMSIADKFYTSAFLDTLSAPTEEQVQSAYFNTKINMYVSHLFFTEKEEAEKAYQRLQQGESFLDVANDIYNISPYDSSAGYIGEIRYFNVDHAFGEAAYALKSGEYSEPVRTRLGYHIIYVNERVGNPLMTQAEFEYKKEGITNRTKDRIMPLKGDAFVRTYMQSLNVNVDENAVYKLFGALKELAPVSQKPNEITQNVQQYPTDSEVEFVRKELEPGTILASYEHLGETRYFLAKDYFEWFRTLPKEEARNKTMASVGRALRNQVFYEAGMENGYDNDAFVKYNVDYKMKLYGAYRVKKYLSEQPVDSIPIKEQKEAYKAFKMNTASSRYFTGWIIEARDFNHASSIKQKIENGQVPSQFDGFKSYSNANIREVGDFGTHVFKIAMQSPFVVGTENNFYVLQVNDRRVEQQTFEDVQDDLVERMKINYNLFKEIKNLRSSAEIALDSVAFEKLIDHYDEPGLQPSNFRQ
jgi:parvulin-like peptidyl-prolyl isomerase